MAQHWMALILKMSMSDWGTNSKFLILVSLHPANYKFCKISGKTQSGCINIERKELDSTN